MNQMKKQVHSLWKMTRRTMLACLLLLAVWQPSMAQTALTYGDVAICGWNNNLVSSNRQIQVVLLKACAANTVFKISALGFNNGSSANSASNGRATAGISKWTNNTGSTLPAGTVITILNNGTTISSDVGAMSNITSACACGANGSPVVQSTSGGRFFIYYGGTSDGTGSGQDLTATSTTATFQGVPIQLFGFQGNQSGYTAFLTTGTTGNFQTYLPSDLASYNVFHASNAIGGYFTLSRSAGYTAASLRSALQTTSNWSTVAGAGSTVSIPSGNFTMGTTPTFTGSTSLTACNAVSTSINSNLAITDAAAAGAVTETWSVSSAPTHGTLGGFSTTASSTGGAVTPSGLTYTPTAGYTGTDAFTVQVSNGTNSSSQTVSVTVAAPPNPGTLSLTGGTLDSFCATASCNLASSGSTGGVWSSANTSIATVDNGGGGTPGRVTGIYSGSTMPLGGTTTISYTVSTVSCGTTSATKAVYVRPFSDTGSTRTPAAGTILCTGATVTATSNSVTVGLPRYGGVSYGRTWTTQNASIASVNNSTGLITAVSAGTVNITYTTAPNGCGSFNSRRNITVQTTPSAGTVSGTTPLCVSASATYASTGTAGGTWTTSNSSVASVNASTGAVTGVSAGSATISYTVTSGSCGTFMASQAVSVLVAPSAGTVSGTSPLCVGGSTATYTASGTSGGTWSTSNASVASVTSAGGVVSGVGAGSANITYTVTNSCGSDNANQAVTVNTAGSAGTLSGASSVCAGATTTLSTTGTGGTWSSSNTARATVDASGVVTGLSAGSVTISYTVSGACGAGSATQAMTVNAAASAGTISGATSVCESATTTLSTSGAGGSWSSSNTSIASVNASTGVVYGVAAGSATISYIVSGACGSGSTTSSMTVNPLPNAGTISGTATVCTGATTTLSTTGTGGSWSSSNTARATVNASGVVTGVGAGSVTISYAITNSCGTDIATQAVTVNPIPNAGTISGASSVCAGATTTLTTSGSGGSWSSSATSTASINTSGVVFGVAAGSATISYTASNSCGTDVATQSMTVNPSPNAGAISGTATVCVGATTTLTSSGSTGGTWSSSNTARATVNTTGDVTGVGAGSVTISYSVTNSCGTSVATQAVTVNPLPNAGTISGASSVCAGANTTLSTSGSGGSWSSSATSTASINTSGVVFGVAAGSATISYTASNSCGTDVATQSITVNPLPNAGAISGASTLCVYSSTTLTSSGSTGGTWSSSNTARATVDASGSVTGVGAGSVTISYSVTNSCGTSVATQSMTINPIPNAGTISGASSVCAGANTTLSTSGSGGSWSSSATSTASVNTSGVVHGVAAGSATISYSATNSCGTDVATQSITVNPLPDAGSVSGATTLCVAATTTLTSSGSTGGTWSSSNTARATVDASTGDVTGVGAGSVTISYAVTNSCGTDVATQSMTINPLPNAGTISGASSVCESATTSLTSSGTSGGTWSSSATSYATVTSTGLVYGVAAGSATISYAHTNSCGTDVATTSITVDPRTSAGTISGASAVCVSGSTTLTSTVTGGSWSSSIIGRASVDASTGDVTGIASGSVTISYAVTGTCGTGTTTQSMTVNPLPNAGVITGSSTVCESASITLTDGVSGGTWSTSASSTASVSATGVVYGVAAGSATISYTVSNSCGTDVATRSITVNPLPATPGSITGTATIPFTGSTTTLSNATSGGTWSSSNTAILAVNASGVVTAVSAGTATITYTVSNSCGAAYTTRSVTCASTNHAPVFMGGDVVTANVCANVSTFPLNEQLKFKDLDAGQTVTISVISGPAYGSVSVAYTVTTTGGTIIPSGLTFSPSITHLGPDSAYVRVTDGIASDTVKVRINVVANPVTPTISGATSMCLGTSTTLTASPAGGYFGSMDGNSTTGATTGVITALGGSSSVIYYNGPFSSEGCRTQTRMTMSILNVPSLPTLSGSPTVCPGSSTTLSASIGGGSWVSSNTSIATVTSGGSVTGVAAGVATISYTLSNMCGSTTTNRSISISSPTTLGIISGSPYTCIGSTATLTNTTSGGTWSSTNTSVANISAAGVVSPVSVGMDTIIYSYTNSCGLTASVSRSFRVYPLGIPATLTGPSTVVNGSSITLTTSTPGGTWTTSNAGIASLSVIGMSGSSSRLVTGVSVGTATISYQISSPCAMLTSTRVINVTSSRMNNTAGAATEGDVTVSLFPNPTSGTVAVELSNAEGQTDVIVTDIAGKVVLTQTSATPKLNIDLSKVAAGTYFVKVKNAGYTFNEKIIVE